MDSWSPGDEESTRTLSAAVVHRSVVPLARPLGGPDPRPVPHPLLPEVVALLRQQDGVVSRRQLLGLGVGDPCMRTWLRRKELCSLLPGVYVDHTGPPSWRQRAWGAVLYAAPAVLQGPSALRAESGPGRRDHDDAGPVQVLVGAGRTVRDQPGVRVHRTRRLEEVARWHVSPPRCRVEDAVLDVASVARDDVAAYAVLARAVGARLTTPLRLQRAIVARGRIPRRAFLVAALDDLVEGACSVIERAYLRDVERAHGLPRGDRQVRGSSRGPVFRDVHHRRFGVTVELDGRADHTDVEDRDTDLDRDLDAVAYGETAVTLRLGWGQTVGRPCRTAVRVARVLQARGWDGEPVRCPDCP